MTLMHNASLPCMKPNTFQQKGSSMSFSQTQASEQSQSMVSSSRQLGTFQEETNESFGSQMQKSSFETSSSMQSSALTSSHESSSMKMSSSKSMSSSLSSKTVASSFQVSCMDQCNNVIVVPFLSTQSTITVKFRKVNWTRWRRVRAKTRRSGRIISRLRLCQPSPTSRETETLLTSARRTGPSTSCHPPRPSLQHLKLPSHQQSR